MNLAEKLARVSDEQNGTIHSVSDEIINYFKEYVRTSSFEKEIEERIMRNEGAKRDRKYTIETSFWAYHDGCSETNYSLLVHTWKNPEHPDGYPSWRYKNVSLQDCQDIVVPIVAAVTEARLKELGFSVVQHEIKSGLGYRKIGLTISW